MQFGRIRFQNVCRVLYFIAFGLTFWGPVFGGIETRRGLLYPARILTLLVLAAVVLELATYRITPITSYNRWCYIFFGLWLSWAMLSLLWTVDRDKGLQDLFNLFIGLSLVGMAPNFLRGNREINRAAGIWVATFFFFLGIGIVEHLTTLHLPMSRFSHGAQQHLAYRPTAVFVNENNYAVFISMSLPFLLTKWKYCTYCWNRILWGTGIAAGIYFIFVTGSRINYFVMFVSILLFSLLLTSRGQRLRVLTSLTLIVIGVWLFFGITQPAAQGYLTARVGEVINAYWELVDGAQTGERMVSSQSIAVRINMIRNGILFLRQTWGRGVGVGNFEAWIVDQKEYSTMDYVNPHNWWVELSVEYGLFIALSYVTFFIYLIRAVWKKWLKAWRQEKWVMEALLLVLAVFPLLAFSTSTMLNYAPHWLMLTMACAAQQQFKEDEGHAGLDDISSFSVHGR